MNSERAVLEWIGRLLANNSCTTGEVVVEAAKGIPTSIALDVIPTEVIIVGQAVLKVTFGNGNGKIEPGQTDARIATHTFKTMLYR